MGLLSPIGISHLPTLSYAHFFIHPFGLEIKQPNSIANSSC